MIGNKLNYLPVRQAGIHNNPADAGIVDNAEDYVFSSAIDYTGHKGLINVELLL